MIKIFHNNNELVKYYYDSFNGYLYKWERGKDWNYYKPNGKVVACVCILTEEYNRLVKITEEKFNELRMMIELKK